MNGKLQSYVTLETGIGSFFHFRIPKRGDLLLGGFVPYYFVPIVRATGKPAIKKWGFNDDIHTQKSYICQRRASYCLPGFRKF